MPDPQLVFSTCPDAKSAEAVAETLVAEGLAACVNVVSGLRSVYRWHGKLEKADEHLLLIKSTSSNFSALCRRIRELHPYELPEVLAVPISDGLPEYLSWIENPE
jgi:periplasmic divalent cation tolerance protein